MATSIKLAPSILSADFARLGEQVAEVERAGADRIHVDVMDGHFVPNITIGPVVVKSLRPITRLPLEVHLMISQPDLFLDAFAEAGADLLLVHQEDNPHLNRTVQHIHSLKKKAGVVINPSTPAEMISEILPDVCNSYYIGEFPMYRTKHVITVALCTAIFAGAHVSRLSADDKPVKPTKEWNGSFPKKEDEPLAKAAPASGYIADEKSWTKLWKAWREKEEAPKIDFDKQLVLVGTTECAANKMGASFKLDDKGDLKGGFISTQIAGPGFAYMIVVVDRTDVKTYNGAAIKKE
jgi:hypothetical protein